MIRFDAGHRLANPFVASEQRNNKEASLSVL